MKNLLLFFLIISPVFSVSQTKQEIEDYFNEVAYSSDLIKGPQSEHVTKWNKNIKLFIDGDYTIQDSLYVKKVISELNIILNGKIKIMNVKTKTEANSTIYFGDFDKFNSIFSLNYGHVSCFGLCVIYTTPISNFIEKSLIFIDHRLTDLDLKHTILEELTQSLGLCQDSWKYPDSIFYEGYSTTDKLSKIDKEVIKMLYK